MSIKKKPEVSLVHIEEVVVMKILKHAKESLVELKTIGQLHGNYNRDSEILEVTNSYPSPPNMDNYENYDQEMTKRLEQVDLDNNRVGIYQVSYKTNHLVDYDAVGFIKECQLKDPLTIYLVYDVLESELGDPMPLKAYKLNPNIIQLSEKEKLSYDDVKNISTKYDKILLQIPLKIISNPINKAIQKLYKQPLLQQIQTRKNQSYNFYQTFQNNISFMEESLNDQYQQNEIRLNEGEKDEFITTEKYLDTMMNVNRVNDFAERLNFQGKLLDDANMLLNHLNK